MPDRASTHTCHARGCGKLVPPKMFMCRKHWYWLPKWMRDRLWELYVPGQENRMDPSAEYILFAGECVAFVAAKETGNINPFVEKMLR